MTFKELRAEENLANGVFISLLMQEAICKNVDSRIALSYENMGDARLILDFLVVSFQNFKNRVILIIDFI